MRYFFVFIFMFLTVTAESAELLTNSAHFSNAPKWLTSTRVNRIADNVSRYMEWSIRRVEVEWHDQQSSFEKQHRLGPFAIAVTKRAENRILLGPKVTEANFDQVFGHELVHVSSQQKYQDAIPGWLEEGVANFVSKGAKVDYPRLAKIQLPADIRSVSHPMQGSAFEVQNKYMLSQALTEMIASRCDFINLLRLSVQRKLEDYLSNICRIQDINADFKKWLQQKSKSPSAGLV